MRKADNLPPSRAVVTKFVNFNFLEPSGPVQAYIGTALPLPLNLGTVTSWNPLGLSRPVMGLIYLYLFYLYSISLYNQKRHAVGQLVEALRYKLEGRGFDS